MIFKKTIVSLYMDVLQKLDIELKEMLKNRKNNLVFLAGAGISAEPPSNLPTARQMMDAILRFIDPDKDAFNKLSQISDLRFEYIIEFFRDHIDKNLKILDYF
ncbi:MAG: hypothetical protein ACTSRZ_12115 [Promethearchaeota archaeon]